ncbi:MAG: hypothetical protein U1F42_08090 [Candidatus Competibacteraceae bacterium]
MGWMMVTTKLLHPKRWLASAFWWSDHPLDSSQVSPGYFELLPANKVLVRTNYYRKMENVRTFYL